MFDSDRYAQNVEDYERYEALFPDKNISKPRSDWQPVSQTKFPSIFHHDTLIEIPDFDVDKLSSTTRKATQLLVSQYFVATVGSTSGYSNSQKALYVWLRQLDTHTESIAELVAKIPISSLEQERIRERLEYLNHGHDDAVPAKEAAVRTFLEFYRQIPGLGHPYIGVDDNGRINILWKTTKGKD